MPDPASIRSDWARSSTPFSTEVDFAEPKNFAALVERHAAEHVGNDRTAIALATEMLERFLISDRAKEIAAAEANLIGNWNFCSPGRPRETEARGRYFQGFIDLLYQDAAGGWHIARFQNQRRHGGEFWRGGGEL